MPRKIGPGVRPPQTWSSELQRDRANCDYYNAIQDTPLYITMRQLARDAVDPAEDLRVYPEVRVSPPSKRAGLADYFAILLITVFSIGGA